MAEPIEQGSGIAWPPPGQLPHDARVFQLAPNDKIPPYGFLGAHHKALPLAQALLVPGPAASYGVALDGQYLLVDRDSDTPQALAATSALPGTWSQTTRRGDHRVYRTPANFTGSNKDWFIDGIKVGQLKIHGYLVGPGSTVKGHLYCLSDGRDPVPAPPELLEILTRIDPAPGGLNTRDQIAMGERDNELTRIAGYFRRHGYTEDAIQTALWGLVRSGLVEQSIGNEILQKDCVRIAHSAMKWATEVPMGPLTPGSWRWATEVALIGLPFEWLIPDFVPKRELTMVYGDGGCGKSSWGSWLASEVTNKHGIFVYAGVEEPFERFAQRAVQGGAREDRLCEQEEAHKLVFPRDAEALEEKLGLASPACLYFDSIMSHFPADDRSNLAEKTRRVLGSLAGVAQRTGTAIIGIFHENKTGEYSGSTEMRNVARSVLHAHREEGADRMTLRVAKPFIRDPKVLATFIGDEVAMTNPLTGQTQYEIVNGEQRVFMHRIVRRGEDIPAKKQAKAKTTKVGGSVNLGDVDPPLL